MPEERYCETPCIFKLEKNGFEETLQLLDFHQNSSDEDLDAFFNFYYHNQWIDHNHFEDEKVMEIHKNNDNEIAYVIGNEYDRQGHLIYHGGYCNGKFSGEGIMFNPDQSYDKGVFRNGKREGVFQTIIDGNRLIREAEYHDDQLNGKYTEFYNSFGADGKPLIKSIYEYRSGRRVKGVEYDGNGNVIFEETSERF